MHIDKVLPAGWKGNDCVGVKSFTNSCRGFNSKKESIDQDVVQKLRPDVINPSETLLTNKAKANHKDYVTFNRKRAGGGGL